MTTVVPPEDNAPEMPRFAPRLRRRTSERFRREDRRELRYLLSIAMAVICSWFVSLLPRFVRNWAADRIGDLWFRMAPTYRSHVFENIGQVLGPTVCDDEKMAMVRRIFRLSANNFADLLRAPHTSRSEMIRSVPLVDGSWTILDDAYARGQGVILLTAHLGSFDYIGHSLSARGYKLTSVTGRTTTRFLFDAVTYLRRSHRHTIVEASPSGVRQVIQALRRGELSAFVADYDFFQNGVPVTFFGRETTLPPGPIRIARDTGALVVGTFAWRTANGYAISLLEPFKIEKTRDLDADIRRGMERVVEILERAIGATPDQWVMFQRVWPSAPVDPVRVFPVGSPLESELLKRVDSVLPEPRRGATEEPDALPPADGSTSHTDLPPRSPAP